MKKPTALFMIGTLLLTASCSEDSRKKEMTPGKYVTEADDSSIEITEDGKVTFNGFDWTLDQEIAELMTSQNKINSREIEDTEEAKQKVRDAIDVAAAMDGKANVYNTSETEDGTLSVYVEIPNAQSVVSFEYYPSDKSILYQKLIREDPTTIGYEEITYTLSR